MPNRAWAYHNQRADGAQAINANPDIQRTISPVITTRTPNASARMAKGN